MATSQHPTLWLNLAQPVSHSGNPAEVFENMLLADEPDWDYAISRVHDGGAEKRLQQEYALGVMP